jgi:hypothetical protein
LIDGLPLSFFLPLVVHALAGLTTGVTGVVAFGAPKRQGRHHRWGRYYLWAYTVVFFTATILSVQRWAVDAYLFFLALAGYGFALAGYVARRYRREPSLARLLGKQWVVAHIVGVIGSYIILWTAFYVDNGHLIPVLNLLPSLTFWVLPTLIGIPFTILSISRFVPNRHATSSRSHGARNTAPREVGEDRSSREEERV